MAQQTSPPRWPNSAKAAISFTMDNLGEAQDVNKGIWPPSQPHGQHPSILHTLPRMLSSLDRHNSIKATYFAESWSLSVYPSAVADLRSRGHEVAWHGYQHESWATLSADEEAANFRRSFEAAEKAGVVYAGFRPPGGKVNGERTYDLFRRYGVKYVSPLGEFGVVRGGDDASDVVVVLPFEWRAVDAFYYMEKFAGIREAHGESAECLSPRVFRDYLMAKIDEVVKEGGYLSVLFHPFLQTSEEKLAVMEEVLERIAGDSDIWCAPCGEVARWVSEHAEVFEKGYSSYHVGK